MEHDKVRIELELTTGQVVSLIELYAWVSDMAAPAYNPDPQLALALVVIADLINRFQTGELHEKRRPDVEE